MLYSAQETLSVATVSAFLSSHPSPCYVFCCNNSTEGLCLEVRQAQALWPEKVNSAAHTLLIHLKQYSTFARPSYNAARSNPRTIIPLSCRLEQFRGLITEHTASPLPSDFKTPTIIFLVNYEAGAIYGPFVATSLMTFDRDEIFGGSYPCQVKVSPILVPPLKSTIVDWFKGPGMREDTLAYLNRLTGLEARLKAKVERGAMSDEGMYDLGNQVSERS